MIRLPRFEYFAPGSLDEATRILADRGPEAMVVAGGTGLLPNMKRRQQVPKVLVSLGRIPELKSVAGVRLGAGLTLSTLCAQDAVKAQYPGLWQAAAQVATPQLRNMGTLGGNLCLDTRCNYYDQSYEWRKSINFCMKKDGDVCWVAPGGCRCWAISSTDIAPALVALNARVRLVSRQGAREIPVESMYRMDGMDHLTRKPDEILSEVLLDDATDWRSTYWKLRRRGSFDFPVLSAAAAIRLDQGGVVQEARIVLGAVASKPLLIEEAGRALTGKLLTDDSIAEAAEKAFAAAKPLDMTDFTAAWRKRLTAPLVTYALKELRGDDMSAQRERLVRHEW